MIPKSGETMILLCIIYGFEIMMKIVSFWMCLKTRCVLENGYLFKLQHNVRGKKVQVAPPPPVPNCMHSYVCASGGGGRGVTYSVANSLRVEITDIYSLA